MLSAIAALGAWIWIIAGLLMMGIELLAPGLFFIWLGLAALATGLTVAVFDLGWAPAAMLFTAFAVASVFGGRALMRANGSEPEAAANLNALSRNLIGQTIRLDDAIQNGKGRIRIGDTVWQAFGEDAAAGDKVRIVRLDGSSLVVERV
ncbi:MAG: NfeD family protein [Bosea sp. (in: a-proteobacteria)]